MMKTYNPDYDAVKSLMEVIHVDFFYTIEPLTVL